MKKPIIEKSLKLWEEALKVIPCGSQTMSKCPDQFNFGISPIYLDKGKGCMVRDVDGNWFIDYACSLGPIILGHNHKKTVDAVKKQLINGITFSLMHPAEIELAKLLIDVIPCAEQVRFAKNGTDVTLAAVRLAKSYTGKSVIVRVEGHYHGWSDWFAITMPKNSGIPRELEQHTRTFKYNDLDSLKKQLSVGDVAAVIMEPVSLIEPDPGFLEGVREACSENNVILIFDEMITGFRWSIGGAQKYYGVTPDLATFGKAVSNGMPLSIIVGKKKYMDEFSNIFFSMTFGGEVCSLAAAIATITEMKENKEIFEHIWRHGNLLREKFNSKSSELGLTADMVGLGPRHNIKFDGFDPRGCKDLFNQEMCKRGILIGPQIYVNWSHKQKHINKTIKAMYESLEIVSLAVKEKNIDKFLQSARSALPFRLIAKK